VVRLGRLQLDPTAVVARSEHLVLWSRIGDYDVAALDRFLYRDKKLFEYRSWILPMTDYDVYRHTMNGYLAGPTTRQRYIRDWLAANASFRRYIVATLRTRGPLRSRDFEDRAAVSWRTGGWNDGKNVGRMLDALWYAGVLAIVGRDGGERIWDLADRHYPAVTQRLSVRESVGRHLGSQLRARGVARASQLGSGPDGKLPEVEGVIAEMVEHGIAVPVQVAGLRGHWYADSGRLEGRRFIPRTTLLSPFDELVSDRARTRELFGFDFKLEIYVPAERREYGYYVMPILRGERLIGRLDPFYDRASRTLRIRAVYAEPGVPAEAGAEIAQAIRELARWLGAERVEIGKAPAAWKRELRFSTAPASAGPA
jgi:uncharacterized protein YcaQ